MKYRKRLKIIELLGCVLIIVGLFLPLITAKAEFFGVSDSTSYIKSTDGIVVLVLSAISTIILLIECIIHGKLHRENKSLEGLINYVPLLLMIIGVVFFAIGMIEAFRDAKNYSYLTIVLNIGFYMISTGFIMVIITLILERFIFKQSFKCVRVLNNANFQNNYQGIQNMNNNMMNNPNMNMNNNMMPQNINMISNIGSAVNPNGNPQNNYQGIQNMNNNIMNNPIMNDNMMPQNMNNNINTSVNQVPLNNMLDQTIISMNQNLDYTNNYQDVQNVQEENVNPSNSMPLNEVKEPMNNVINNEVNQENIQNLNINDNSIISSNINIPNNMPLTEEIQPLPLNDSINNQNVIANNGNFDPANSENINQFAISNEMENININNNQTIQPVSPDTNSSVDVLDVSEEIRPASSSQEVLLPNIPSSENQVNDMSQNN